MNERGNEIGIRGITLKKLQRSSQFHKLNDMEKLAYLYLLEEFVERLDECVAQDTERRYLVVSMIMRAKYFRCADYTCCKLMSKLEQLGFVFLLHGPQNDTPFDFLLGKEVIISIKN